MTKPISVLFVCLGNICRSPMAMAIFKDLVKKNGLTNQFHIDSAGLSNIHEGEPYHLETRRVCKLHGVAIDGFSRPVVFSDFQEYDYLLCMDDQNFKGLQQLDSHGYAKLKIFYFRSFALNTKRKELNIPDPYYGDAEDFDILFDLLTDCAEGFLQKLRSDHQI